ncbi:biotin--[acetyl-CoA-carboxylase] ligase [Parasediminibacterium paludis]|uniref:Biotin--[acetyl-CoA-carboxylase] ligase n=1 Tax=Parasediminibacterium paludis TaxID=908966 RepID=A0ABV8Q0I3_9BACT
MNVIWVTIERLFYSKTAVKLSINFSTSHFYLCIKNNTSLSPIITKNKIGQPFVQFEAIYSTNSYAIDSLQANLAAHGTAYFAHHQTAGKGQRGKEWHTQPSSNIILSVIVDSTALGIHQQFQLSVAVALACHDFFSQYAGDETTVKWPNDIYWRDRKAAGILIENIIKGNVWQWAVVGIGININQTSFGEYAKNPVSLKQITGEQFDTVKLAKELCNELDHRYQQLLNRDFTTLLSEYNQYLYKAGQVVKLKKDTATFTCTIKQVNSNGQLEVIGAAKDCFEFGEVEWVI